MYQWYWTYSQGTAETHQILLWVFDDHLNNTGKILQQLYQQVSGNGGVMVCPFEWKLLSSIFTSVVLFAFQHYTKWDLEIRWILTLTTFGIISSRPPPPPTDQKFQISKPSPPPQPPPNHTFFLQETVCNILNTFESLSDSVLTLQRSN